jgi:hypothetical protein
MPISEIVRSLIFPSTGLSGAMVARWTSTTLHRVIQRLRVRAPPEMLFCSLEVIEFYSSFGYERSLLWPCWWMRGAEGLFLGGWSDMG